VRTFRNHLLCELPATARMRISERLKPVRLRRGLRLQGQGEQARTCYFLESGVVSLVRILSDGRRMDAGLVGREGMIGSIAGPTPAFIEASVELAGEALAIEAAALQAMLTESASLRDVLARYQQYLLDEAQAQAACNASHMVDERLAKWLLRWLDRADGRRIPTTHDQLASTLGVQRTTVTGALQRLTSAGALATGRGAIEVLDRDALLSASCDCYEQVAERLPELGLVEPAARLECPAA
jgi:CRP-like cAMP-binding protein